MRRQYTEDASFVIFESLGEQLNFEQQLTEIVPVRDFFPDKEATILPYFK